MPICVCHLDERFAAILQPVLQTEVEGFWKDLFEVADAVKGIHRFENRRGGVCGVSYIVGPLLGLVTFLVFGCFGFVLSLVLVGHVFPTFTEDLADLTWRLELLRGDRGWGWNNVW